MRNIHIRCILLICNIIIINYCDRIYVYCTVNVPRVNAPPPRSKNIMLSAINILFILWQYNNEIERKKKKREIINTLTYCKIFIYFNFLTNYKNAYKFINLIFKA